MMTRFPLCSTALRLATLLLGLSASAATACGDYFVSFRFGGVIDDSDTSLVEVGTRFSGIFTYDLDADDQDDDPEQGYYVYPLPGSAPAGLTYTVGDLSFAASTELELIMQNDVSGLIDRFIFEGTSPGGIGDAIDGYFVFNGATLDAFTSDRPPPSLDLAAFETTTFGGTVLVRGARGRPVEVSFFGTLDTLTPITITAVPEPSALLLMGIGTLATLGSALGRRRINRAGSTA
jgi:hypothetical protein